MLLDLQKQYYTSFRERILFIRLLMDCICQSLGWKGFCTQPFGWWQGNNRSEDPLGILNNIMRNEESNFQPESKHRMTVELIQEHHNLWVWAIKFLPLTLTMLVYSSLDKVYFTITKTTSLVFIVIALTYFTII